MAELKALAIQGPDPALHEVVRWRCRGMRDEVSWRFGVGVHESTIGKWLHQLDLSRLRPRPYHPQKEPHAETFFLKYFPAPLNEALPPSVAGKPIEKKLWGRTQPGSHSESLPPCGRRIPSVLPSNSASHRGSPLVDYSYVDQGIQILNLARNAHPLFAEQPAKEKRSLLNFLVANATWAQRRLTAEPWEPFDILTKPSTLPLRSRREGRKRSKGRFGWPS